MKEKLSVSIFFVLLLLFLSPSVFAECSDLGLRSLIDDTTNTTLHKEERAKSACLNKDVMISGWVFDISRHKELYINSPTGIRYTVSLAANNHCGDILSIKKGASISITGKVKSIYLGLHSVTVKDAVCRQLRN